jgi:signal transduction histidine kinase
MYTYNYATALLIAFPKSLLGSWQIISLISILAFILTYSLLKVIMKQLLIRQKIFKLLIERKAREITRKTDALEKNMMVQTRLISIISHDIITPLRFIHVTSKALLDNKDHQKDELQDEMLLEISNTAKELELLSTNIMNWIKYQNENRRLVKEAFDLHQMANQIFSIFQGLARQKRIQFVNEVHTGVVMYQYMEPVKIVLYNLILNALNFTEKGNITISGGNAQRGILLKVQDEGVGMTPEQIENVMSETFVVSSATIDKRKGNGLGYIIIKDMLKLVDARFVIKSKKNMGTMVTIFFPNNQPSQTPLKHP